MTTPHPTNFEDESTADSRALPTPLRAGMVVAFIYLFLVGVSTLEKGIKLMGEDLQEDLFASVSHPIAGLSVGILGTVLVQSSSASTSAEAA